MQYVLITLNGEIADSVMYLIYLPDHLIPKGRCMKIQDKKNPILLTTAVMIILFVVLKVYAGGDGVMKRIRESVFPVEIEEQNNLLTEYLPDNAVMVDGLYQNEKFWTECRKDKISRFKCSGCHNNEKVNVENAVENAHGDIELTHGSAEKPLNCFTCHNKNERDFLRSERRSKIDMDHSYKMCGQCHFRQEKDWKGGAHGKRLGYWAGDRTVMNCTSCHDPHSPRFKQRWPKTYSPPEAK